MINHFRHLLFAFSLVLGLGTGVPSHAQLPAPDSVGTPDPAISAPAPVADPAKTGMREALDLMKEGKPDAALEKANALIEANPKFVDAYLLRGNIYAEKQSWREAETDYEHALGLDGNSVTAKLNLGESKFRQKDYDGARTYLTMVENDPNSGDIAAYKVFLCDLFGGREDVAAKELDAFNQTGANASYYFSNAAWDLYHKKPEDARGWINSAVSIYQPNKVMVYSISLKELGYLPLPAPSSQ